jgi:hypothetical protein
MLQPLIPNQKTSEGTGQPNPLSNLASGGLQSNPEPSLTEHQKALKDKFGLNEHACAVFDAESPDVKTFVKDSKGGKFDPNILKRFLLWLCNGIGGPKYDAAVQQFRTEMAATKNKGLFRGEEFQTTLATAINSCDSNELPHVLSVVHDLLAADPEVQRDFFINKLLIPCLNEIPRDISETGTEIDAKSLIGKYGKFLAVNDFCVNNNIEPNQTERSQFHLGAHSKLSDKKLSFTITRAMYYAIFGSENERNLCSQYLKDTQSSRLCLNVLGNNSVCFEAFDEMNNDLTSILQGFGENQNEQIASFKAVVEALRNISHRVTTEWAKHVREEVSYNPEKSFTQKASECLLEKPALMWAVLKMEKTNEHFSQALFMEFIDCPLTGEGRCNFLPSVALQAIKKAVVENSYNNLSDEQVLLLCGGANLSELLRNAQAAEGNKATIDTFLKFIQNRALSGDPAISFEDIMPAGVRDTTYQQLVTFVEKGSYNEDLKAFIKNGRKAQGTPSNP